MRVSIYAEIVFYILCSITLFPVCQLLISESVVTNPIYNALRTLIVLLLSFCKALWYPFLFTCIFFFSPFPSRLQLSVKLLLKRSWNKFMDRLYYSFGYGTLTSVVVFHIRFCIINNKYS